MSKSIIEAAKQVRKVLEEVYDVTNPILKGRVWQTANSWCVFGYGQRAGGDFALCEMFDGDFSTIDFVFPDLSALQRFVDGKVATNK